MIDAAVWDRAHVEAFVREVTAIGRKIPLLQVEIDAVVDKVLRTVPKPPRKPR